ncbi:MAG TPA: folylpolyglutamate synthase/dihydrofolate synthase family protein, partial [Magnetospirillum sp.]|nr:folylpolyglutamate synthase/dihydrofolate synthase family protein [Magnetospirillum sp.]
MIDAILDRLTRLHPKVIDLSLTRVLALLDKLGRPQEHLPPVVHVAGTNGKGSTVATLRALAEAAGLTVHVYTSPHLVRFAERVRVSGRILSDSEMEALLEEVERVNGGEPITFFEVTTAAAFLAFARTPADLVILETGLGGRLDATNVVARPALTIITPIAMDHEAFLGSTLPAIAGEKAGILKAGVPCVVAEQLPEARTMLAARAAELGAPVLWEGPDFMGRKAEDDALLFGGLRLPAPALAGDFQYRNTGLALAAMDRLARDGVLPRVGAEALAKGITSVQWPARLQRLTHGPLVDMLPAGWELWLDGGHNPHAAKAIAAHAATWRDRPLHAVFGMLSNKDVAGYFAPLAPLFASLRAVAIPGEANTLSAEDAAAAARAHGCPDAEPAAGVDAALRELTAKPSPARVLICGSLYLAGV